MTGYNSAEAISDDDDNDDDQLSPADERLAFRDVAVLGKSGDGGSDEAALDTFSTTSRSLPMRSTDKCPGP